jgi:hypothetical protein
MPVVSDHDRNLPSPSFSSEGLTGWFDSSLDLRQGLEVIEYDFDSPKARSL